MSAPNPNSQRGATAIIIGIVIVAVLGLLVALTTATRNANQAGPSPSTTTVSKVSDLANNTIVYGGWQNNRTVINGIDLQSGDIFTIATIPLQVKRVTAINPETLLFIGGIDETDRGTNITSYSLKDQTSEVVYNAEPGFGVDEYKVSPNGQYVVTWETKLGSNDALSGGASRVYRFKSETAGSKTQLFSQQGDQPVNYPIAVTDAGIVLTDTFKANSGAGWAYGMYRTDVSGNTQAIASMQNGTYASQPTLSPDGKKLLFVGYNGNEGPGTEELGGNPDEFIPPTRRAIINGNTIDTYDIASNSRTSLTNLPTNQTYVFANWTNDTNTFVYGSIKENAASSYDLQTFTINNSKSKNIGSFNAAPPNPVTSFITALNTEKLLMGQPNASANSIFNLGDKYSAALQAMIVLNAKNKEQTRLPIDQNSYFIQVTPNSYFQSARTTAQKDGYFSTIANDTTGASTTPARNIALEAFTIKKPVQETRTLQQSVPVPSSGPPLQSPPPPSQGCEALRAGYQNNNPCADSPLYLYGPAGTKIAVSIDTPIYQTSPEIGNQFQATVVDDGKMSIAGQTVDSVKFGYVQATSAPAPQHGLVVPRETLRFTVLWYAANLGLNEKETRDLVTYAEGQIDSPYALVSYYDDATSKALLPMRFSPEPDTYQNIVFYFKQLPNTNVQVTTPIFPPVPTRTGVTAIEISARVE